MAFATTTDIGKRLGRELTANELESVTLLLEGATSVIASAAYEDDTWAEALDPVPNALRVICIELVCRALANPNSLQSLQESIGQASKTARFGPGMELSNTEERIVRRALGYPPSGSSRPASVVGDFYPET